MPFLPSLVHFLSQAPRKKEFIVAVKTAAQASHSSSSLARSHSTSSTHNARYSSWLAAYRDLPFTATLFSQSVSLAPRRTTARPPSAFQKSFRQRFAPEMRQHIRRHRDRHLRTMLSLIACSFMAKWIAGRPAGRLGRKEGRKE